MDADAGCNHFARERMMIERRVAAASTAAVSWFRQHLDQDQ
jgi:hypothetical protein